MDVCIKLPYLPYRRLILTSVSKYAFTDESGTMTLFAQPVPWKGTFHSMQIDFKQNENGHSQGSNLHRRSYRDKAPLLTVRAPAAAVASYSVEESSGSIAPSTATGTPTLTSISFPFPESTETAVGTGITKDVGRQLINYPILPSNNSALADIEGQIL